jgi:hypothetical protein
LIPPKPRQQDLDKRLNIPADKTKELVKGWGHSNQDLLPRKPSRPPTPVEKAPLNPVSKEERAFQSSVRHIAEELVDRISKETWEEQSITANLHEFPKIAFRPLKEIIEALDQWAPTSEFSEDMKRAYETLKQSGVGLRIFMAYVQPDTAKGKDYNELRIQLFKRWLKKLPVAEYEQFGRDAKKGNFAILRDVFSDWRRCIVKLQSSSRLQESDIEFADKLVELADEYTDVSNREKAAKREKLKILRKWDFVFSGPDWVEWKRKAPSVGVDAQPESNNVTETESGKMKE